jgi:hypothetical protein
MRRMLVLFLTVVICGTMVVSSREEARAYGVRAGAYYWFAGWKPTFEDWMLRSSLFNMRLPRIQKDYFFQPTSLYGPILTLDFTSRVNLSTIFVVGKYRLRATVLEIVPPISTVPSYTISSHPDIGIFKYDLDATLNIMLSRWLKIFWGVKYQRYSYKKADLLQENAGTVSIFIYTKEKVIYHGLSTGLGLGFNFTLIQDLHLLWNVSGLYQKPVIIRKRTEDTYLAPVVLHWQEGQVPDYSAVGANSTLSFAYVFDPISTTLSIGIRYQYLYTFGKDTRGFDLNRKSDHFYGLTVAAVYSYQTAAKEKE